MAARKATKFHADGSIARAGLLIPGARWTTAGESHTKIFIGLLRSNGGYYLDEQGRPGLDRPEAVETLDFMVNLVRQNIAIADGWRDFGKQRSVMTIIPNYDRPVFQAAMGDSFFLLKTAFEIRKGYWISDVCSSDLISIELLSYSLAPKI